MIRKTPNINNRISGCLILILGIFTAGFIAGCAGSPEPRDWPFAPEVEEFVEIYAEAGGDKLKNWVQGETTSTPEEALAAFQLTGELEMELVASEPVIRQPINVHFDERGRLWVVQYIQYPFPAGVTIQSYDQYLRAEFDGVPDPPPNHFPGADKVTVLEDTNGDGVFNSHQDVITGLNITTSVLTGGGGVWVMNPPYLLFYPDRSGDGLPNDGPEVRLEGFGLEDTHSLANSLRWGPDGWIYGVHGSTSTSTVRGITFLGQAVWRYHPDTDQFELFSQGGGNPWTLSFDSKGRAFSGDNGGNNRGYHWVQGGRYQKNFPKHGPFTRPHSYGHFPRMEHEGYSPRFAMTFTIYEEGKFPGYEGQLISGMAMTNRVQATRLIPQGSTWRTVDTDSLAVTEDRSFRPVDITPGPDGAVYFADWCDIRMDHVDSRDTWDKSCGRIWRLQSTDHHQTAPFNLAEKSNDELMDMLADERKWYRKHARRLLGERKEASLVPELQRLAAEEQGQLALEALWTANLISGIDPEWSMQLLDHHDEAVRRWTVRLIGDGKSATPTVLDRLIGLARNEPDPEVRSQLASSAMRFNMGDALSILRELIQRNEDTEDGHIPLLIWWTLEEMMSRDTDSVLEWLDKHELWQTPVFKEHLSGRIARRLAIERGDEPYYTRINPYENWMEYAYHPRSVMPDRKGDYTGWQTNYTTEISRQNLKRLSFYLEMAPEDRELRRHLLSGVAAGLEQGPAVQEVPESLQELIELWWQEQPHTDPLIYVAASLGHPEAVQKANELAERSGTDESIREKMANLAAFERGREAYLTHCALCHQADGAGMERLATPLRNSEWVLGEEYQLIPVVLQGLQDEMFMPSMGTVDDHELADILTYIRRAWGNDASPVSADAIRQSRKATADRTTPWTSDELKKFSPKKF